MYWPVALTLLVILGCTTADKTIRGKAELEHDWAEAFKVIVTVPIQYQVSNGWRMVLIFTNPIKKVGVWRAISLESSVDMKTHSFKNMYFNTRLAKGQTLTMAVVAYKMKKNSPPGNVTVLFKGGNTVPTLPSPESQNNAPIYHLSPLDESDSGFKMILAYRRSEIIANWRVSLKFTKPISTRNFNIDKAIVAKRADGESDSFCLGPRPYNQQLKANSTLRLEFNCLKAKLYEAAPNAFFVFHPNSTKCEEFDIPTPAPVPAPPHESTTAELVQQWPPNYFKMRFNLQVINSVRGGWKITLAFSKPVAEISNLAGATFVGKSKDNLDYYIENTPGQIQSANLKQCARIKGEFSGKLQSSVASPGKPLAAMIDFERKEPEYSEISPNGACPV